MATKVNTRRQGLNTNKQLLTKATIFWKENIMNYIPEKRLNWVTDSKTPQKLIDQAYNQNMPPDQRYFKPPETEEESITYYERFAAWQAMWQEI